MFKIQDAHVTLNSVLGQGCSIDCDECNYYATQDLFELKDTIGELWQNPSRQESATSEVDLARSLSSNEWRISSSRGWLKKVARGDTHKPEAILPRESFAGVRLGKASLGSDLVFGFQVL